MELIMKGDQGEQWTALELRHLKREQLEGINDVGLKTVEHPIRASSDRWCVGDRVEVEADRLERGAARRACRCGLPLRPWSDRDRLPRSGSHETKIMGPRWGRTARHLTATPDPGSCERWL
jgi:hypothetical protein